MKKAVWLVVSLVALLALTAIPAVAEGETHRYRWEGERFALLGQVTAVDTEAETITVMVYRGSRLVKGYLEEELVINTIEHTRFLRYADPKCEVIAFEDIEVDSPIGIRGYVVPGEGEDVFLAKVVVVDVPLQFLQ
jgi:hypothetical protein